MTQVPGFDPLVNIPTGRILTRPQYEALWEAAISLQRVLTASEIEEIVGTPLDTPSLKRDFKTGEYPRPTGTKGKD